MLKKDFIFGLKKSNDDDRTIEGVFSTSDVDRSGDPPIDQATWNLKNFKKNPVVLYAHDSHNIVIGTVPKIGLDEKGRLAGKIRFAVDEGVGVYGDFIKTIYNLYKARIMRTFSVGFMMGEIVVDKKNRTKMVNNELLEISCVPVPANALALAKQKGLDLSALDKIDEIEAMKKEENKKPYPNEHACRLRSPKDFEPKSFRRTTRKHNDKEYSVIMGKLKGEKTMTEQAYRYDKKIWKESEARSHCKEHKGTFEPAKKFILYVDKKNKKICIFDKKEKIGEGIILKQFRNILFKNKKKVVTENPTGRKEKSSREKILSINKIIRTLLKEKQRVKSNKEK